MDRVTRKKILIIEKQPNYRQLLVKQVMFAGLSPLVAVTGEGGLRKAMEYRPNLILLELDLTDMDGLEFVSLLKEKPQVENIHIGQIQLEQNHVGTILHRFAQSWI